VQCAAGYNLRWLLRMIAKKGIGHFRTCPGAADFAQFFLNWARAAFNLRATTAPLFGARLGV